MPNWLGNTSNWLTASNWDSGTLPSLTTEVDIGATAHNPVLDGGGYSAVLTVTSATLTIGGTTSSGLEVTGNITETVGSLINLVGSATLSLLSPNLFGNLSLKGGGTIAMSDSPTNFIVTGSHGLTLTSDNTISGSGHFGNGSAIAFTNNANGVVNATGQINKLEMSMQQAATNFGLIEGTGAAGLEIYRMTVNNQGAGQIEANGAGAHLDLAGATINAGTFLTPGGGVINAIGGANVISGITNIGHISVNDGGSLTLRGAITNALGSITVDGDQTRTYLDVDATGATLAGPGLVTLSDNANNVITGVLGATLTNLANDIAGAGEFGAGTLTLVNLGVITATSATNALMLDCNGVTNTGLISDTGAAGLQILNTTINGASGGTISAIGDNSHVDLQGANLQGGTLSTSGQNAVIQTITQGNIFDGSHSTLKNKGTVKVAKSTNLELLGAISNSGTISIDGGTQGAILILGMAGATLSGGGQIALTDSRLNDFTGYGASLTNVDDTIAGAGLIEQMSLTNAGRIEATFADNALQLNTTHAIINNGALEALAAELDVGDSVSGFGFQEIAAGGALKLSGASDTEGVTFIGPNDKLILNQSTAFGLTGELSGFAVGDSVQFDTLTNLATFYKLIWNARGDGGVLDIVNAAQPNAVVGALSFSGSHNASDFSLSNNGYSLVVTGASGAPVSSPNDVIGGGQTIATANYSGNQVAVFDTGGAWDIVNGSNATIGLTNAQVWVNGVDDAIDFTGGSGNVVALNGPGSGTYTINGYTAGDTIDLPGLTNNYAPNVTGGADPSSFSLAINGNVATQTNADGSRLSTHFNIAGQNYTTILRSFDAAGDLTAVEHEGVTGAPYDSYTNHYYGAAATGYVAGDLSLNYTNQSSGLTEVDLDGSGNLTRALYAYPGTTPGSQTGFEADYVAGQYEGGDATYKAPAGAHYSAATVEYDTHGQSVGAVYTVDQSGQPYDEAKYTYSAGAQPQLTEATFSHDTSSAGPAEASFFYNGSGALAGSQYVVAPDPGQSYSSNTALYDASNVLIADETSGYAAKPFSSQTYFYDSNGAVQQIVRDFTSPASAGSINGQAYNAFEKIFNPAFTLLATAYHLDNGGNVYVGVASNVSSPTFGGTMLTTNRAELSNTLYGGDWTITGGGTGETFNFAAFFNKAEITDYGASFGGATDVISVSTQDFADWPTMLGDAAPSGVGGVNTTFTSTTTGDKLTLDGVTVTQLQALTSSQASAFFHFH